MNFKLMAENSYFPSYNFFLTDINKAIEFSLIKIKDISNFSVINQPEGILKANDQNKDSEITIEFNNEFEFNELIPSLSANLEQDDILTIIVIYDDKEFSLGNFSISNSYSFSTRNSFGEVNVDTLRFYSKIKKFSLKIKIYNNSKTQKIIKLINVTLTDRDRAPLIKRIIPEKKVDLNIPKISQMIQQVNYNEDICSPTSLSMVLNYYGIKTSTLNVVSSVMDKTQNIYGNWLFNTLYASTRGLYSFIARINSYEELYYYLSRNISVIASITFGPGELKNSPIKKTAGHLVVIRGIDKKGDIIVNDPASKDNKGVTRVYDAIEFANAWFKNKYGTAYLITDDINNFISSAFPYTEIFSKDGEKLTQITPDESISFAGKEGDKILIKALTQKIYEKGRPVPYKGYADKVAFSLKNLLDSFVINREADIYNHKFNKIGSLSMGTALTLLSEQDNFYLASVSDIIFYIKKEDIIKIKDINKKEIRDNIIKLSRKFLGVKYDWGGRSFNGIDCSALSGLVYKVNLIEIPRNANDQYIASKKIKSFKELKKGDLIFSTKENSRFIEHVMIYSGDEKIIEATRDSNNVREINFYEKFGKEVSGLKYGDKIGAKTIYFGRFINEPVEIKKPVLKSTKKSVDKSKKKERKK